MKGKKNGRAKSGTPTPAPKTASESEKPAIIKSKENPPSTPDPGNGAPVAGVAGNPTAPAGQNTPATTTPPAAPADGAPPAGQAPADKGSSSASADTANSAKTGAATPAPTTPAPTAPAPVEVIPAPSGPLPTPAGNLDMGGPRLIPPGSQPPPIIPPLPAGEPAVKPGGPGIESLLPGTEIMLIPNGILPAPIPRIVPTPDIMGFHNNPEPPPPVEVLKPEEIKIPVSQFKLRYALLPGQKPHHLLPPIEALENVTVQLAQADGMLIAPDPKAPAKSNVSIKVDQKLAKPMVFRGDALEKVSQAIVGVINKTGIYGVYVILDPAEIDRLQGKAYDRRGGKTDLAMVVYVSEVAKTRTIRRKLPFRTTEVPIIDDPRDARIKSQSPVGGTAGTTLLDKPALQNYLSRLNRFPGRRVDAAINASGVERQVILDYLIREEKPIFVYAQTSNTGTPSTGQWRTRAGFEYKQIFRLDDILRGDYITTDFHRYNAALASYEFAPIFPDYLKFKTFGTYANYSASDIGFNLENFQSTVYIGGEQVTYTPTYVNGFPVDLFMGFQWLHDSVNNQTNLTKGAADFALPYIGLGTERTTEKYSIVANGQVETNFLPLSNTQSAELDTLGRLDTDRHFSVGTWNLTGSTFLEPIIFGKDWDAQQVWWKSTRAHEFALSFRGQVAFDRARLTPQMEMVAGGFDTVRGYPESLFSGDSVMLASAEYRFHVPRAFLKPSDAIDRDKAKAAAGNPNASSVPPNPGSAPESRFAARPTAISGGPDWDLILRGFFDYGQTYNNEIELASERNRTLAGVGGGVELQLLRPLYITLRMDVGVALIPEVDLLTQPVERNSVAFHFSGAIAW